jgi:hypothetical protein
VGYEAKCRGQKGWDETGDESKAMGDEDERNTGEL